MWGWVSFHLVTRGRREPEGTAGRRGRETDGRERKETGRSGRSEPRASDGSDGGGGKAGGRAERTEQAGAWEDGQSWWWNTEAAAPERAAAPVIRVTIVSSPDRLFWDTSDALSWWRIAVCRGASGDLRRTLFSATPSTRKPTAS